MKIGIALSGGGTRGMAHVGALQALAENDIFPDVVSGTSAGSVVGALYAYGYVPGEIRNFAQHRNLLRIFGLKVPNKGFVRHAFLRKQLNRYLPQNSFHILKRQFHVTVANLHTGQAESWAEGPLIDLIVASSSIPIMFEPINIEGQLYVDGGLLRNLPASPIRDLCDVLIGINLVPQVEVTHKDLNTLMAVGTRVFDLSALNNIKPELSYCNVVIAPPAIHRFSRFNFREIETMYEIGYDETMKQMDKIKQIVNGDAAVPSLT